jgi:hypothetical protein
LPKATTALAPIMKPGGEAAPISHQPQFDGYAVLK